MTQERLNRLCTTWKKRLRLQDWDVVTILLPDEEEPETFGCCHYDVLTQTAKIDVMDRSDAELTLIHELLHLRMIPFGDDDSNEKQAAMNLLAISFMQAYNRGK